MFPELAVSDDAKDNIEVEIGGSLLSTTWDIKL
jgi:hypothetical protein